MLTLGGRGNAFVVLSSRAGLVVFRNRVSRFQSTYCNMWIGSMLTLCICGDGAGSDGVQEEKGNGWRTDVNPHIEAFDKLIGHLRREGGVCYTFLRLAESGIRPFARGS